MKSLESNDFGSVLLLLQRGLPEQCMIFISFAILLKHTSQPSHPIMCKVIRKTIFCGHIDDEYTEYCQKQKENLPCAIDKIESKHMKKCIDCQLKEALEKQTGLEKEMSPSATCQGGERRRV
jgi:hypothetical protein